MVRIDRIDRSGRFAKFGHANIVGIGICHRPMRHSFAGRLR